MAAKFEYAQAEEIRDTFARHGVRYLFLGKSGAILLGYPDTTQDADLFVEKSAANGAAIVTALDELGFQLDDQQRLGCPWEPAPRSTQPSMVAPWQLTVRPCSISLSNRPLNTFIDMLSTPLGTHRSRKTELDTITVGAVVTMPRCVRADLEILGRP